MPNPQLSPQQLANYLDKVLPPHSNRIMAQGDLSSSASQIAQLMTDTSDYQISDLSKQMIRDRMLTEVSIQRAKGRYTRIIPFGGVTRLVAALALISVFSFAVLNSEPGQPLYAVQEALGLPSDENPEVMPVTTLTVMASPVADETVTPTFTSTPAEIPTETALPTTVPTEIEDGDEDDDEVLESASVEDDIVILLDNLEIWYISTTTANIRAEPDLDSEIITTLSFGTATVVTGFNVDDSWAQVFLEEGVVGWVSSELITETDPTINVQPATNTNAPAVNTGNNGNGNNNNNFNPNPNNGGGNGNGNNGNGNNRQPRPPRGGNGRNGGGGRGGN